MNRPHKLNALDQRLRAALRHAFDRYDEDPSLRCAVLTGAGRAFCTGSDLSEMVGGEPVESPTELQLVVGTRGRVSKPVVAAVNGPALGAGFLLQQDCDLVVASSLAVFGVPEATIGRGSPWATPLVHMVPQRVMAEILLTGEPISAHRALEIGLVNSVTEPEDVLSRAMELARRIARNAPLSVVAAKQSIGLAVEHGRSEALDRARRLYSSVYTSQDAREGPRAFAEGRDPRWIGA